MPVSLRRLLPLALVAFAALWLRTHDLARRPMHADEANQAVKAGELLESGRYAFDPHDHHGPTLYYAALPIAWLRGERTLTELTETTVRLVPALAGTLAVILLYLFVQTALHDSRAATPSARARMDLLWPFLAAAFLAVAPPAVYYNRYFVQETLLLAFTLLAFFSAQRWWRTGSVAWAVAAGVSMGLMQATKSSAPLFLVAAALGALAARPGRPTSPNLRRDALLAITAAAVVFGLFYSSFGTHPAGLRDAFSTYFHATERAMGNSGHEKPWWYYLQLYTWTRAGGLTWQQLAFSAFAVAGIAVAFFSRRRLPRAAAIYLVVVAAALSFTPYKTPWHAIHLAPAMAILATSAIGTLPRWWMNLPIAAVVLWLQYGQTRLTCFLRPADARNPYAYVHSSPDVLKVRALADAALANSPDGVVRVISEEYWPIPWYLRGLPRVGYWETPPADCDAALVIASSTHADAVRERLRGSYRESLLGLRPGFLLVVFTRQP